MCSRGSPESPPSSFFLWLFKFSLLLFVVFVNMIAAILFFIAKSTIFEICSSLISGETFNNKGMLVFLSFLYH